MSQNLILWSDTVGKFISLKFDKNQISAEVAERLVAVCPVDIFAFEGSQLVIQPQQEDECTLCELCLDEAPASSLVIHKLYGQPPLVSRGKA
jgi:NAD-dependent dihydropyrimidine dehydrogenase PreA subunit